MNNINVNKRINELMNECEYTKCICPAPGKTPFWLMTEKEHHVSSDMMLGRDLIKCNTISNTQGH